MMITASLPQNLTDVLNSDEFDDEAGIVIEGAKFSDKDLRLFLQSGFMARRRLSYGKYLSRM